MKTRHFICGALALLWSAAFSRALEGDIRIHDPSTVVQCDGTYYVFGTGRGIPFLTSPDAVTWTRGANVFEKIPESVHSYVPKNNGMGVWAPDVIKVGDQYLLYYSVAVWGQLDCAIGLVTSPTLNPKSPDYKWTDRGMIVHSVPGEDVSTIDPGAILTPEGKLWLCYGTYHGTIQIVELDPKTGLRLDSKVKPIDVSRRSEASDLIVHDGFYYLFVNHGSCCKGAASTYRICVGRSKEITGPYLDRAGKNLLEVEGELFAKTKDRQIGPGHFGLIKIDGVEKFSCHYEADLDHGGKSALEIQPFLLERRRMAANYHTDSCQREMIVPERP